MTTATQILVLFSLLGSPPAAVPEDTTLRTPNEQGRIPVLVYHHIGSEDGRWTRTPDGFRRDLELLHARGYRPIRVADLAAGRIDLPRGLSPVVITFDDASPNQFHYLQDGSLDPNSAVGVLEAFGERHPEWQGGATFCLLSAAEAGNAFFGDQRSGVSAGDRRRKIQFLAAEGYELCNHTWWHGRLDERSAQSVREQIGRGQMAIDSMAPGHAIRVFALPLGLWPQDRQLAVRGAWVSPPGDTVRWSHDAVLLAGSELARSPHDPEFDPHAIQRLQVIGDNLAELLDRVERVGHYVSAGPAPARAGRVN